MFGVSTGPPNVSMVPYPTSSQTIIRMLGDPSGAIGWVNGAQSGVASLISTAIFPFHGLVIASSEIRIFIPLTAIDLNILFIHHRRGQRVSSGSLSQIKRIDFPF
jgi:hypothetical protein